VEESGAALGQNKIDLQSTGGGETSGEAEGFFGQATFSAGCGLTEDGNLLHTGSKDRVGPLDGKARLCSYLLKKSGKCNSLISIFM
jgi:hypothetical protein